MKKQKSNRKAPVSQKKATQMLGSELAKTDGGFKEIERVGSTLLKTNEQMLYLTEELLIKHFKFTENDLIKLRNLQKQSLTDLVELTRDEQHPLSANELGELIDLGKENYRTKRAQEEGISLPTLWEKIKLAHKN